MSKIDALEVTHDDPSGLICLIAGHFRDLLDKPELVDGGKDPVKNYLEMELRDRRGRSVLVTIARSSSRTPHALRRAALDELDGLRRALGEALGCATEGKAPSDLALIDAIPRAEVECECSDCVPR